MGLPRFPFDSVTITEIAVEREATCLFVPEWPVKHVAEKLV